MTMLRERVNVPLQTAQTLMFYLHLINHWHVCRKNIDIYMDEILIFLSIFSFVKIFNILIVTALRTSLESTISWQGPCTTSLWVRSFSARTGCRHWHFWVCRAWWQLCWLCTWKAGSCKVNMQLRLPESTWNKGQLWCWPWHTVYSCFLCTCSSEETPVFWVQTTAIHCKPGLCCREHDPHHHLVKSISVPRSICGEYCAMCTSHAR